MELEQRTSRFMLSILILTAALLDDRNADSRRQFPDRRRKIDVLVLHHESKNASPNAAAETMKRLSLRVDVKRRRFLLMKWTECLKIRPRALQWKIGADHFDDVVGGGNLLDCFWRNHVVFYFSLVCWLKRCQNLLSVEALSK